MEDSCVENDRMEDSCVENDRMEDGCVENDRLGIAELSNSLSLAQLIEREIVAVHPVAVLFLALQHFVRCSN